MRIQEALRALPTKPGVTIAIIIIIAVLGWQGYSLRESCTAQAEMMARLTAEIEAASLAGEAARATIDLSEVTPFTWDEVRIVQNYRPTTPSLDCPFGWHWSEETRNSLAAEGLLTVLAFFRDGGFVGFMDYSGELAVFDTDGERLSRAQAKFHAQAPGQDGGPYRLQMLEAAGG